MEVKIKVTLTLCSDGSVRMRHELPESKDRPEELAMEASSMFGFGARMDARTAASVCESLPTWIAERFQLEVKDALAAVKRKGEDAKKKS